MLETLTDEALCTQGFAALETQLGAVQALRFLSLISRETFDYQCWRDQHFSQMGLNEILEGSRSSAG
jgi:hypothetical protein